MDNKNKNAKTSEETKNLMRLLHQRYIQRLDTTILEIVRHLVFISSILAGFLFTVISDLILSSPKANDLILIIIFSCLIISSLSLFACIIFGAIYQYLFNIEIKESSDEFFDITKYTDQFDYFLFGGLVFTGITFLTGILFFILSFILIGWLRSFVLVLIALMLFIGLGSIAVFLGYKIISFYATRKVRPEKTV